MIRASLVFCLLAVSMNALIAGRRMQGKSTLALALAAAEHDTVIVFDPNAQYGRVPGTASLEVIAEALEKESALVAYQPNPADLQGEFGRLVAALRPYTDWSLIIDEAHVLQGRGWMHEDLAWLMRRAPVRPGPDGVAVIQAAHRVVDFHTDTRALVSDHFLFFADLARDLDGIEAQYGADVREEVAGLSEFRLVHYWIGRGGRRHYQVWRDPRAWYVDIGRP